MITQKTRVCSHVLTDLEFLASNIRTSEPDLLLAAIKTLGVKEENMNILKYCWMMLDSTTP